MASSGGRNAGPEIVQETKNNRMGNIFKWLFGNSGSGKKKTKKSETDVAKDETSPSEKEEPQSESEKPKVSENQIAKDETNSNGKVDPKSEPENPKVSEEETASSKTSKAAFSQYMNC